MCKNKNQDQWINSLIAGGTAGLTVDLALYPLDTIKTRIQSQKGFWASGGFSKVYSGLAFASSGSVPNAAAFFFVYDFSKKKFESLIPKEYNSFAHMGAAICGEIGACTIRMPIEVVKQRAQANKSKRSLEIFRQTYSEFGIRGLYRGYGATICREIPFSLIQFPIWERLKILTCNWRGTEKSSLIDSAICGAISGGISAFFTTPLDVAKTRIILAEKSDPNSKASILKVLRRIWQEERFKGLFSGAIPRVMWISIGGAIFLGGYDATRHFLIS